MMNQEDLFRKLGSILNELNDQYEYLAQNPQKFNELELELFLANANFLTDHIQIIRKLNDNRTPKELPEHSLTQDKIVSLDPPLIEEADIAEEAEDIQTDFVAEKQGPVREYQEEVFRIEPEPVSFEFIINDRPQAEIAELSGSPVSEMSQMEPEVPQTQIHTLTEAYVDQPDHELKEDVDEVIEEVIEEEQQEQQTALFEEIEEEPFLIAKQEDKVPVSEPTLVVDVVEEKIVKPTLNDLLASTRRKDNPEDENPNGPPIKDLKQAINLNDKLLYIKDLFNGYNLAYSEAIDLINKMPDFKTADAFLKNNYAVKNNWAAKQATVDKFYELLNRRF